jgi:ferredoxin
MDKIAPWDLTERFKKRRREMKVKVDKDLCTGIGNCAVIAPGVFKLDEKRKAVVLDPKAADKDTLVEAASNCPMEAITVIDDNGEQLYPYK